MQYNIIVKYVLVACILVVLTIIGLDYAIKARAPLSLGNIFYIPNDIRIVDINTITTDSSIEIQLYILAQDPEGNSSARDYQRKWIIACVPKNWNSYRERILNNSLNSGFMLISRNESRDWIKFQRELEKNGLHPKIQTNDESYFGFGSRDGRYGVGLIYDNDPNRKGVKEYLLVALSDFGAPDESFAQEWSVANKACHEKMNENNR